MKKYILIIVSIIFFISFSIFLYFYSVWSKEQAVRDKMVNRAYDLIDPLDSVNDISYFTSDKDYYFIEGQNKNGIPMLVWMNEEETNYIYLFDYVSKDEIKKKALEIAPTITVKRINPGIDEKGKLIYEILYEDKDKRLGYQYFYLQDGEFIKMYRLGKTS